MIDWYTGLVGYDASHLDTGQMLLLDPGGVITFQTDRWFKAEGSYSSTIQVKADLITPDMLSWMRKFPDNYPEPLPSLVFKISGNPSKFLQGHNAFGPSVSALGPVIKKVIWELPDPFFSWDAGMDEILPAVHRSRVDVTTSIRMDNDAMVHEFIRHAQEETRSRHRRHQGGLTGSTSVTWGAGSTRWMITCYCKLCELLKHPVANPDLQAALLDYAQGLLRVELRLFRKELADRGTLSESLIWDFYDRIEVGVMKNDADKQALTLRPPVRLIYQAWLDGHDVSPASGFIKRAAFYKYRREILEATGQDISLPPAGKKSSKVSREVFGTDYLKAHEETEVPEHLQKYLFKPGDSPVFPAQ